MLVLARKTVKQCRLAQTTVAHPAEMPHPSSQHAARQACWAQKTLGHLPAAVAALPARMQVCSASLAWLDRSASLKVSSAPRLGPGESNPADSVEPLASPRVWTAASEDPLARVTSACGVPAALCCLPSTALRFLPVVLAALLGLGAYTKQ